MRLFARNLRGYLCGNPHRNSFTEGNNHISCPAHNLLSLSQAILTATARPQGLTNSGVASAVSVVGTTVVPIDEPDCQKEGGAAAAADDGGDGNPAVQVLKVRGVFLSPFLTRGRGQFWAWFW